MAVVMSDRLNHFSFDVVATGASTLLQTILCTGCGSNHIPRRIVVTDRIHIAIYITFTTVSADVGRVALLCTTRRRYLMAVVMPDRLNHFSFDVVAVLAFLALCTILCAIGRLQDNPFTIHMCMDRFYNRSCMDIHCRSGRHAVLPSIAIQIPSKELVGICLCIFRHLIDRSAYDCCI